LSLNGNLEDIPLLDILQIIAFSQKTGYQTVESPGGEAALVFRDGLVITARTPDSLPPDPRMAELPEDKRKAVIRQRVETALEQLIRLREGAFTFHLTSEPTLSLGSRIVPAETLREGLKPEELLLELARSMDEDRRDSVALVEAGFAEPPEEVLGGETPPAKPDVRAPQEEMPSPLPLPPREALALPPPSDHHRIVLLLEDEADLRSRLAERLIGDSYQVVEADDPLSAVRKAKGLSDVGLPFTLIADRGMPASDGSSFNGGLEAVHRLQKSGLHPPVLLMTDRMTRTLYARARRMGVSRWVFKPMLSRLDPAQFEADLRAFGDRVLEVLPGLQDIAEAPQPTRPSDFIPLPRSIETWDELTMLQRQLEELSNPHDASQVSKLVLKAARDFFERAVLFLVKDEELRGLGGFAEDEISFAVRDLVIPLAEPSVFQDVVAEGRPFRGALPAASWARLTRKLGGIRSEVVALFPLISNRETIAVLFGDNPRTGVELHRLEILEVFVHQAGVALEDASFRRKLRSEVGPEAGRPLGSAGALGPAVAS
jgi:CheY-like chemotaxis protein